MRHHALALQSSAALHGKGGDQGKQYAEGLVFENRGECFPAVDSFHLGVPIRDESGLMARDFSCGHQFVYIVPLAAYHLSIAGTGNYIPDLVFHEGIVFLFHGLVPFVLVFTGGCLGEVLGLCGPEVRCGKVCLVFPKS